MTIDDDDFKDSARPEKRAKSGQDYEVGYGKPPKASQWPPGKSGNPRGKKTGSRGLKTDLDAVLKETVTININKRQVRGTTQFLALKTLGMRAASGDPKAIKTYIDLTLQIFGAEDRGGGRAALSPHDQAILDARLGLVESETDEPAPDAPAPDSDAESSADRPSGE